MPTTSGRWAAHFIEESCSGKLAPVGKQLAKRQGTRPHLIALPPFVSSTVASIDATCPAYCPFKGTAITPGGCYVSASVTAKRMRRLDLAAMGMTADEVIRQEVLLVDTAWNGRPIPDDGLGGARGLRLHDGGDVSSVRGAKMLAGMANRWRKRGGGLVWTYTRRWLQVPRQAWGADISVIASVTYPEEVERAKRQGYPSAIVVPEFPRGPKRFQPQGSSVNFVQCPAQSMKSQKTITCVSCGLCFDDRRLLATNRAIAFELHGRDKERVRGDLVQLGASSEGLSENTGGLGSPTE